MRFGIQKGPEFDSLLESWQRSLLVRLTRIENIISWIRIPDFFNQLILLPKFCNRILARFKPPSRDKALIDQLINTLHFAARILGH